MFGKLGAKISSIFKGKKLDSNTLDELEELLITSDISYNITSDIIKTIISKRLPPDTPIDNIKNIIRNELEKIIGTNDTSFDTTTAHPYSIVMVGVNGSGKTSTIGKLTQKFITDGKKVAVVACDTYRLSATEQLRDLITPTGAMFISRENADPSGLAYDGYNMAKSQNADIIMIDTAGRLATNTDLMAELQKIIKTIKKLDSTAPSKTILVLDGNGGQNSLLQMEKFSTAIHIDGVIVTKTESSSKSGFIVSLRKLYPQTPILFTTYGETLSDIESFNTQKFLDKLLEE